MTAPADHSKMTAVKRKHGGLYWACACGERFFMVSGRNFDRSRQLWIAHVAARKAARKMSWPKYAHYIFTLAVMGLGIGLALNVGRPPWERAVGVVCAIVLLFTPQMKLGYWKK
jgi:hypothetical protein